MQFTRPLTAGVIAAALLSPVLTGCSSGATATGHPTGVPATVQPTPAPPTPTKKSATPTPTPPEQRVKTPGPPPVAFRSQQGAGQLQINTFSWQRTANGEKAAPPAEGYLVLEVTFTATEGQLVVNPLYLQARSSDGRLARPTMGSDGNEPVLAGRRLATKETTSGVVTFDVPRVPTTIQLSDEVGTKVAEIPIQAPPD